jgi:hypothetical protein
MRQPLVQSARGAALQQATRPGLASDRRTIEEPH